MNARTSVRRLHMAVTLLVVACTGYAQAGGEMDGNGILVTLRENARAVKNHRSVTLWKTTFGARQSAWSRITFHWDDLGRAKYCEEPGSRDEGGNFVPDRRWCWIYNGEITADFDYTYDLSVGPRRGIGTYTHASIRNGPGPGPKGPSSLRNPLFGPNARLVDALQRCVDMGSPISVVEKRSEDCTRYDVSFVVQMPGSVRTEYRAVIDLRAGANVTSLDVTTNGGEPGQENAIEYRETSPGSNEWIPARGATRILRNAKIRTKGPHGEPMEISVPPSESQFECIEFHNNDPQFAKDSFDIVLEEGTFVFDQRYQVDYRVGDDAVIASKLSEIALLELGRQQSGASQNPYNAIVKEQIGDQMRPSAAASSRPIRWYFVWMSIAALAAAALLVVARRARGRL